MTTFISVPSTLNVVPPVPVSTGFANGSNAGSYDAATDVWTPGRLNGVVNASSWSLVPTGRWVQIAGTRLDGLTAAVMAGSPGWSPSTLAWNAVMNAWNGFAIDTVKSRMWLVAAGGHADGSNTGIYRFDAFKMAWAVEKMPSNRTLWSQEYASAHFGGGSYTGCNESAAQASAKQTAGTLGAINDWGSDEVYWDNPSVNPGVSLIGNPTSRHVYSGTFYAASSNELILACRRFWRYSITSGQWTYKRAFPAAVDGAELYAHYDEKTHEMLFGGCGDGVYTNLKYDLTTNTWGSSWCPWSLYGVADTRHQRDITNFSPPMPDRADIYPGKYWKYNLDSRSLTTSGNVQFGGGLTIGEFLPSFKGPDGCGITYIPGLNRYWILYVMNGWVMRWLQLDPTTTPWTLSPLTFANPAPPSQNKPMRKIVYLPDLNAVMFFSSGSGPGYLYKF